MLEILEKYSENYTGQRTVLGKLISFFVCIFLCFVAGCTCWSLASGRRCSWWSIWAWGPPLLGPGHGLPCVREDHLLGVAHMFPEQPAHVLLSGHRGWWGGWRWGAHDPGFWWEDCTVVPWLGRTWKTEKNLIRHFDLSWYFKFKNYFKCWHYQELNN